MKGSKKGKLYIFGALLLSFFGVTVSAISTYAWFSVTGVTKSAGNNGGVSSSSDISVDRITGFKYEYDEPAKGEVNYSSGQVTPLTTKDEIGDKDASEELDEVAFDIPDGGTGFYIMGDSNWVSAYNSKHGKSLDTNEYAYKFEASEQMIEKSVYPGQSYSSTMYYKKGVSIGTNGTSIRIKKHYFVSGATTNTFMSFGSGSTYSSSLATFSTANNITTVTISSAGIYDFWYDYGANLLSVEKALIAENENLKPASPNLNEKAPANNPTKKNSASTTSNRNYTKIIIDESHCDWNYRTLFLDNFSFSDGYNIDDFEYFAFSYYGTRDDNMSASSTTKSWKRFANGFNLCAGGSGNTHEFILPPWVSYCSILIETSKGDSGNDKPAHSISMNYLNNLHAKAGKSRRWDDSGAFRHSNFNSTTSGTGKTVRFTEYWYQDFNHGVSSYGDTNNTYTNWQSVVFETSVTDNSQDYTWSTQTVVLQYVDTSGNALDTQPSAPGNIIDCNNYTVPSDPTGISGYSFIRWDLTAARYNTSTHTMGSSSTTTTSADAKIQVQSGITLKAVFEPKLTVTLSAKFFLSDGTSELNIPLTNVNDADGNALSTTTKQFDIDEPFSESTFLTGKCWYFDENNAIWYVFDRDNTSTWYTDSGVSFSGVPTDGMALYAKFIAKPLATIHVDIKNTQNQWGNMKFHPFIKNGNDIVLIPKNSGNALYLQSKCLINNKLYRLTIPATDGNLSVGFLVQNDDTGGNVNQSTDITTITNGSYLRIVGNGPNSKNNWFIDGDVASQAGQLWISRAADNYSSSKYETLDMPSSVALDTSSVATRNLCALEEGVILYKGDILAVHYDLVVSSSHYYWHDTLNSSSVNSERVTSGIEGFNGFTDGESHTTTTVLRITKTGRYTIYFTYQSHEVAIANVPLDGNGYYVMTTTNSGVHTGFENAHKMKEIANPTTNIAYFKNLYVEDPSNTYIFVRSYNDNVDLHYKGHHDNTEGTELDSVLLSSVTGYSSPGPAYFNVYLYKNNSSVTIYSVVATDERSTFFNLNSLSSHGDTIQNQNTSLIMEASFTVDSIDATSISVVVNNSYANVGSAAICTDERIKDPYTYMRNHLYGYDVNHDGDYDDDGDIASDLTLQSGNHSFDSLFNTTGNDKSKIYYAYIIFDYLGKNNPVFPSGTFSLYIKSTQTVVSA